VRKSTSHQRRSTLARPHSCAILPARWGGMTFSTSDFTVSKAVLTVFVATSTSLGSLPGTYSIMPGYKSRQARSNSARFEVMTGFASSTTTLERGLCVFR